MTTLLDSLLRLNEKTFNILSQRIADGVFIFVKTHADFTSETSQWQTILHLVERLRLVPRVSQTAFEVYLNNFFF